MDTHPLLTAALDERYLIERELGSGGMAIVYLARDRKLDREVALKVLRPELGAVLGAERFLAEIKISARLDHPHILTLIDSGNAEGFLYYVLPYVRGESLRSKLDRERQLSVEEAIAITKQVASALDYAHRQGLVHRDIKPENILLQEGEAMLADFGIALAVSEAGGNRLTQTGLSLGTPQYMSPEQATGDRGIDARSDVYSLAAVLYEMLGGEPPVSGGSAQSMIAKLMTEKPVRLRVLRDSIPVSMDDAIAKALSKTPADRFASAGEFMRAAEKISAGESGTSAQSARKRMMTYGGIAAGLVIALAGGVAVLKKPASSSRAVLGEKTQLTSTGAVNSPAISGDGKQLAYITKKCGPEGCRYSITVQDVGSPVTRIILEGATAAYGVEWSPDRRNLLMAGTVDGRAGAWIVSALGGNPHYLGTGAATFYAGGDSLLIGPTPRPDSVYWMKVASLDGLVHDSIPVRGSGQGLTSISSVPGTTWILTLITQPPRGLWQVIGRDGKVFDRVVNACTCGGVATRDAVWLIRAGSGNGESIVRIGLDRSSGRLATRQDTMASGLFTGISVTDDGAAMVMDEGTYDYSVWALDWPDLQKGNFPEERRVAHSSSGVSAAVSPDGARLGMRRTIPLGGERAEIRFSTMPFAGEKETPLAGAGLPVSAFWTDSVTIALSSRRGSRMNFVQIDVRNGAQRNAIEVPDSVVATFDVVRDGWIWAPRPSIRIFVQQAGRTRSFPRPAAFGFLRDIVSDASGENAFLVGSNNNRDSVVINKMNLKDGSVQPWSTFFAEWASVTVLNDGSLLLNVAESQGTISLFKLNAPGKPKLFLKPGRPLNWITVSTDLKRATALAVDYRADAWLSKVVRPQ